MDPPDSEFSFSDLFRGRSFEETRVIRNPTKYHPNPACFNVAMCRTGSMFLFEEWGDGVCGYLNVYWGNPHGEVKYAGNLFSQSDRKMKQQLFEEERRRRGYSPI